MVAHRSSISVQALGCEALVILVSSNEENRVQLYESDGLAIVLDTMRLHLSE